MSAHPFCELTPSYKRYALVLITAVYTLNLIDSQLMMLLLEPIKRDLQLSDTQAGFVTGIAFAFFYAAAGLPLARLADRGNRTSLTAGAIGLWGLTVMGCLFVANFTQLVIARIAAAVGEAGCKPPTYSLLGDYFSESSARTRAMSVYWLANPLSGLVAFILGGWLSEEFGWRWTFFIMGLPGVVLAVVVKWTLRDPRRAARPGVRQIRLPPARTVFLALWRQQSLRHLIIAVILLFLLANGTGPWYAAFMMRTYGMGTAELGLWFGLIQGLAGIAGLLMSGYIATRWLSGNEAGQLRLTAIMVASLFPVLAGFLFLPGKEYALLMFIPFQLALNFFFAPTFALMQRLTSGDMRATTLAIVMFLANLIGAGLGPQIVGILSDLLMPSLGSGSLRWAMFAASFVALWSSFHFWQVGRTVQSDLAAVDSSPASPVAVSA